ncbi:hypothetical protein ACLB2K_073392 [Fragaria x ananassa]
MAVLHNLKKVHRFDCSTIFCQFGSRSRRFVVGDPTPTYFSIQNHNFLCTHIITSQDENFTQNYLRQSCGLSPEGAISASKRVKLQCPERADSVLAILRNHGFSETQVAQKTVLPKLHYFTSIGVSANDLAKAVASNPMLLGQSLENHIIPTHKLLKSMLPHKSVGAVLKSGSRIFMANHGTSVLPNISLLRQVGMPQSGISYLLVNLTRLVSLKHESFAQLVAEAKEMGFNMKKSTSLLAMNSLWCKNALNRSRGVCMMSWGSSEDDFISAFRKCPKSMLVSEKKIMQFGEENNPKVYGVQSFVVEGIGTKRLEFAIILGTTVQYEKRLQELYDNAMLILDSQLYADY